MVIGAAGWADVAQPVWTKPLLIAGFVSIIAGCFMAANSHNRHQERRVYWLGWTLSGALFAAAMSFRGWEIALIVFGMTMFVVLVHAYFRTPHIKVGGRIYAFWDVHSQPDPSDEESPPPRSSTPARDVNTRVSARKLWWLLVVLIGALGVLIAIAGWVVQAIGFAAFLVAAAMIYGIGDTARGSAMFRGQYAQAIIALVLSVPAWALPMIAYVLRYLVGRLSTAREK